MARIKCVVLDFDGTLTDHEKEGPLFERLYRRHLASLTKAPIEERWPAAAQAVDDAPESNGLLMADGQMTAPGDSDPYIRCFSITQVLNRELGLAPSLEALQPLAIQTYVRAYGEVTDSHWSADMFRPDVPALFVALQSGDLAVWLVTNADMAGVQKRLACVPGGLPSGFELLGNAQKYWMGPSPEPDPLFASVPGEQTLPGTPRIVRPRRGLYHRALKQVWQRAGASPADTLVIGDVYDIDLALPAALGAHVHLVQTPRTREPYRAALRGLGPRGSFGAGLVEALERRVPIGSCRSANAGKFPFPFGGSVMSKPDVNSEAYIIPPPPAPESAEDRENDFGWGFEDIHRPGEVSGASTSGIWKMNDAVLRLLVASVQAAALPVGELRFHLTPVDYVAQAVVALSLDPRCWRRAFNLINGRVMSHGGLGGIIKALGYPMEMVAVDEWKRRLFALPEGSAFKPLESLLKENKPGAEGWEQRYGAGEARFDVRRTEEALLDAGISCPPVDEALVRTYFRYLVRAGHVPPAAGPSRDLD